MSTVKLNGFPDAEPTRATRHSEAGRAAGQPSVSQADGTSTTQGTDEIKVSERATEVRRLVERVLELPDVRQERVEALRARIASGDFNPSAEEIADAVIKDESQ